MMTTRPAETVTLLRRSPGMVLSRESAARRTGDRIAWCLAAFSIPSRVVGLVDLPGALDVRLLVHPRDAETVLRHDRALSHAVGAPCRVSSQRGLLHVLVSRDEQRDTPLSVRLGETPSGIPVRLGLDCDATSHALVAGATGSGKTTLARTYLRRITARQPDAVRLILIDPKGRAFGDVASSQQLLHPVIRDIGEAQQAVAWLAAENARRMASGEWPHRIICGIDETGYLVNQTGGGNGPVARDLAVVASLGREMGLHLLLITQHPDRDSVGGEAVMANIGCRLIGRVAFSGASHRASGQDRTAAHKLPSEAGWFVRVVGGETTVFFGDKLRQTDATASQDEGASVARLPIGETDATRQVHRSQRPTPLSDEAWEWIAERATFCDDGWALPGQNAIADEFKVGKTAAARWQTEALARLEAESPQAPYPPQAPQGRLLHWPAAVGA